MWNAPKLNNNRYLPKMQVFIETRKHLQKMQAFIEHGKHLQKQTTRATLWCPAPLFHGVVKKLAAPDIAWARNRAEPGTRHQAPKLSSAVMRNTTHIYGLI